MKQHHPSSKTFFEYDLLLSVPVFSLRCHLYDAVKPIFSAGPVEIWIRTKLSPINGDTTMYCTRNSPLSPKTTVLTMYSVSGEPPKHPVFSKITGTLPSPN